MIGMQGPESYRSAILFYFIFSALRISFFLFFSSLLMPNWAESSFALFDFLIKIALFDFNFLHLYSLRGVIAGLLPTHHLRALPPLHVYHQLPAVYRVYESYIFRRILIDCWTVVRIELKPKQNEVDQNKTKQLRNKTKHG